MDQHPDVVIYAAPGVELSLPFDPDHETVWATQAQIQALFGIDQSGVSRHVQSIFTSGEVDRESNMQRTHNASSDKPVTLYSLDVILAVGYRTSSARAITFRKWANGVLKGYLIRGTAINEQRLEELGLLVEIAARSNDELVAGVAEVVARYLPGLQLLREYDEGVIETSAGSEPAWTLDLTEARAVIARVAAEFPADTFFGFERDHILEGIVRTLYSGFGGFEQYPTVEVKAANLLYLVVKDHPLIDGNKRSAAALLITFLDHNRLLRPASIRVELSAKELAAITLLVAMSQPREKDVMIALVIRVLSA